MLRYWPWWLSFLLLLIAVGWFWFLSLDLKFSRIDKETKPAPVEIKK